MSVRRRAIKARLERVAKGPLGPKWKANSDELKRVQKRMERLAERERNGEVIPYELVLAAMSDRDFPIDKGELGGACNRSACLMRPASYYNLSTQKHYCKRCAGLINQYCPTGEPICHAVIEIEDL